MGGSKRGGGATVRMPIIACKYICRYVWFEEL